MSSGAVNQRWDDSHPNAMVSSVCPPPAMARHSIASSPWRVLCPSFFWILYSSFTVRSASKELKPVVLQTNMDNKSPLNAEIYGGRVVDSKFNRLIYLPAAIALPWRVINVRNFSGIWPSIKRWLLMCNTLLLWTTPVSGKLIPLATVSNVVRRQCRRTEFMFKFFPN